VRPGAVEVHMRFTLVHGNAQTSRTPAVPRHWLTALVIVIVAQWLLHTIGGLSQIGAASVIGETGILGMSEASSEIAAYASLATMLISYGALGALAIVLSWRLDGRNLRSIGLSSLAALEAAPWVLAGFVAALPIVIGFGALAPGWLGMAGGALLLLVPTTLVQAGAEEIIFRGVLLASLAARYGAARGLLISAVLFAFWHIYVGQPLPDMIFRAATTFVFGVTAGLLALRQGHLGGVIALHVVWNIVAQLAWGFEGWPGNFWPSLVASFQAYSAITSFDEPIIKATLLPLITETVLVLAATRTTYEKIFAPREITADET
jgi:membrane protease YdiL (CAAX protease family)